MEENKDCNEVVYQLSTIRNASSMALGYIAAANLQEYLLQSGNLKDYNSDLLDKAINLLVKSTRYFNIISFSKMVE